MLTMFKKNNKATATSESIRNSNKAYQTQVKKASAPLQFNKVISVAGYNGKSAMKIFLQPTKYVNGPLSVQSMALICTSNNPAFISLHGEHFIVVGTSFLKLSNKEQLATLAREYVRNDMDPTFLKDTLGTSYVKMESVTDSCNNHVGDKEDYANKINDDAADTITMSAYFGHRTATKVVAREQKLARKSVKPLVKMAEDIGRAEKASYAQHKNELKPEIRKVAQENKSNLKEAKTEEAAAQKIVKQSEKDEKKAKKAAKKVKVDPQSEAEIKQAEAEAKQIVDDIKGVIKDVLGDDVLPDDQKGKDDPEPQTT
jgi:hypothetical protein